MLVSYRKIMVTLDGSDFASQAIPHAYMLAKRLGAELTLYRAVRATGQPEPASSQGTEQRELETVAEAQRDLEAHILRVADSAVSTLPVVEMGPPAESITAYARDHHIDLIVMTSHGRTGLLRVMYGSVAESVLRAAPCPVLIVRST